MTSNFDFLQTHYPQLHQSASQTEQLINSAPRASCFYARYTLEQAVIWLYQNDPYLQPPNSDNLGALIHEQTFKDNLTPGLFPKIRIILKIGNAAAHHTTPLTSKDARRLAEELYHFLYWLTRYYTPDGRNLPALNFNPDLIPEAATSDLTLEQVQQLESDLSQSQEMQRLAESRQQQTAAELEAAKAELARLKQENRKKSDRHDYNEADTRTYLIDVLLKEAGWPIHLSESTEYRVQGMPNESGQGRVDYVYWGDNGKPLAIVEAKRSRKSPQEGQHQAKLYADCLENEYNQRPIIFYSNGYEHWIWDDRTYPPRPIQGFLKKDELDRLIFRRTHSQPLDGLTPDSNIVNRCYQKEAIRRIGQRFDSRQRKALLVMATGTGKTRTAIALVDVLTRASWIKRVLFLADRTALLNQAQRAFKKHLPNPITANLIKNEDPETANLVLSTYPTISNRINQTEGEQRSFGPGYFDLVIVDEAHRSIYRKYRQIFTYFDSLLLGLTATPRDEVERDTYQVFDLEPGLPTFAYELANAIKDGHLVPPKGIDVPFKFMRSGIKYADLSPEEQKEYEEKFGDEDTGEIPDKVNATALNTWLFNQDTVDKTLKLLMEKGLKTEGGDRLGKTIIFARNHQHAEFIAARFNFNYPHYKGEFCQVIDSKNPYAQNLLDDFSEPDKQPTIAVSVDMLDTGVDVPEIVNLVFFKPVYSRIKFNQMIGRGTRLCPELFGPGLDKQEFLVFDLCGNFDYFSQDIAASNAKITESLSAHLFKKRLELSQSVTSALQDSLFNQLHQKVASMPKDNFLVRPHLEKVEEFSQRSRWNHLTEDDREAISQSLASLPDSLPAENHLTKRFDLLCVKLQLAILNQTRDFELLRDKVRDFGNNLEQKANIPMVAQKLELITEMQQEEWWRDATPESIESLHRDLRELLKFVDRSTQEIVYTDFTDELGELRDAEVPTATPAFSREQYRKKVETYIRNNENHVAVAKLKRNLPLTNEDLTELEKMLFSSDAIENRDKFEEVYGEKMSLKRLVRQIVGLDRKAAKEAFSKYLDTHDFSANQIRFIENIIDYLTQNGVMPPGLLYEVPFTNWHSQGLDGVFGDSDASSIIEILNELNTRAG
ncbi:DEAD/DEAH box helicase family protein [Roseofilum reptotaenium CS-1145]|uniref:Heavy metal transporter n=1 Tax=Roseofilum reptotaenium AO1-A TaxID=1925591 RepID=A0A1L9QWX1_9CYAN|nr:DEAD/DEAH box helicase family protein [Roseofilum reptotaenium]MDB9516914.1 DEAD/DEAH box helicase family protein [Roseofilum reptotaenium CS-1145]OJJ27126.1 heavy metal transporter [Roseofilum reptotaenium AO1-A]